MKKIKIGRIDINQLDDLIQYSNTVHKTLLDRKNAGEELDDGSIISVLNLILSFNGSAGVFKGKILNGEYSKLITTLNILESALLHPELLLVLDDIDPEFKSKLFLELNDEDKLILSSVEDNIIKILIEDIDNDRLTKVHRELSNFSTLVRDEQFLKDFRELEEKDRTGRLVFYINTLTHEINNLNLLEGDKINELVYVDKFNGDKDLHIDDLTIPEIDNLRSLIVLNYLKVSYIDNLNIIVNIGNLLHYIDNEGDSEDNAPTVNNEEE